MKVATALMCCYVGVGVTLAIVVAEFACFYLRLFVLPAFGFFPLIIVTLAPALCGVAIYQRALKPK